MTHKCRTVRDAASLAEILTNGRHKKRKNCACDQCKAIRLHTACENPHKCAETAKQILNQLQPKWNPLYNKPVDNLDLNPMQQEANAQAILLNTPVRFDPNTSAPHLSETYRVFTNSPPSE
ncbi:hypothetical protein EXIGLDRAFT_627794, partial [Exidia glandulosa HHB12029]